MQDVDSFLGQISVWRKAVVGNQCSVVVNEKKMPGFSWLFIEIDEKYR